MTQSKLAELCLRTNFRTIHRIRQSGWFEGTLFHLFLTLLLLFLLLLDFIRKVVENQEICMSNHTIRRYIVL